MSANLIRFLVIGALIGTALLAPVDPKKKHDEDDTNKENKVDEKDELDEYGLEYGRYLQQVVQALEEDKEFAKKLENVTADEIKSGKIAKELEFVNHKIRNKLDELKRMELERLRKLARQEMERNDLGIDRKNIKMPQHLNIRNPSTFEVEDLVHLIKTATRDLEKLDQQRREEFKKYEMEKEHRYREELKNMNEEERKAAEAKHQEMAKKHKEHPKVHHPGSKPQLEQVWEEQDHLPKEEFDPKTFFAMHDVNGDGYLDEQEVEAILSLEIKKMYDPNNEEDDPVEMMEEYNRMREHIYKETDANKDGLISKKEFDDMVKRADFEKDEGWKGLDEQTVYTDDEFREFERQMQLQQQMQYQGGMPHGQQGMPYQGAPPHMQGMPQQQHYQGMQQQGIPQYGMPQQGVPQQGGPQYGMSQQAYQPIPPQGQQHQVQQGIPPNQYQHQQGVPVQQHMGAPQGQYQAVPQQQQQQHHAAVPQQQQQQQQQHHAAVPSKLQHEQHPNQIGAGHLPQVHQSGSQTGSPVQASSNAHGQQANRVPEQVSQQQNQQQQQIPVQQHS